MKSTEIAMLRLFRFAAASGLVFVLGAGCAAPAWRSAQVADTSATPTESDLLAEAREPAADDLAADLNARRAGSRIAPPASNNQVDQRAMANVIAELQTLGALDPVEQQKLMENLKNTDQALWPQLTKYYLATLSYQRRLQDMEPAAAPAPFPPGTNELAGASPRDAAPATAPPTAFAERAIQPIGGATDQFTQADRQMPGPFESTRESLSTAVPGVPPLSAGLSPPASLAGRGQPFSFSTAGPIAGLSVAQPTQGALAQGPMPAVGAPSMDARLANQVAAPSGPLDVAQVVFRTGPNGADWLPALQQTIHGLESATREMPRSTDEISQHAVLRLLYLAAGRHNDALRPIAGIPPVQQDFWSQQLYGMSVWLDSERQPSVDKRAAEAAGHLDQARARLGEIGALRIRNLAFCTEVSSYGVIKEFETGEFEPGQEVILYAEVENFKSEQTPEGYHTALQSSYQIFDSRGQRVAEHEFPVTEETCRNRRRDFFLRYHIFIPEQVYEGGRYSLQLMIEDTLSRKIGQSSVELTIKP